MAFENLPNVDGESAKNLFRECMLAPNMDIQPPTDDMRLSFEDDDFKVIYLEVFYEKGPRLPSNDLDFHCE